MEKDKRNRQKPIPSNLKEFLTEQQEMALAQMENFGWKLEFIRRPLFAEPTVVIFGPDNGQIGILNKDGSIDREPDLSLRSTDSK